MRTPVVRGIALILLLGLTAGAQGCRREPPRPAAPGSLEVVAVSLEPPEIHVGDMAHLTLIVEHPAGGTLELPELEQGKKVVVRERKQKTVALPGARARTTADLLLTSFEIGDHPLAADPIRFVGAAGTLEKTLPGRTLRTTSVLRAEDTPLREIKDLARWPAPVLWWAALAAGILLLGAALFYGIRRWRSSRRENMIPDPPPVPPHEVALRALAVLKGRQLIERRQVEPFYLELSAIVRSYIEGRFGLRAPERTTEEFIREAMLSGRLGSAHQGLVREFLVQCDLVKFARHRPLPDDMMQAFAAAERLVHETRPPTGPLPAPATAQTDGGSAGP